MIIIETAAETGTYSRRKADSLKLVKPSSYSSRLDVYALVCPFFVRRKIWLVIRAEGIYGGTPLRVMDAGNGTKECSGRRPARFAGKGCEKVTGNFSTTRPGVSRICANPCRPAPAGAGSGRNQKGQKTQKTAFFALLRAFPGAFFPTPGQHCACRFLPFLGVSVWNFCPNIGFIILSEEAQKKF